MIPVDTPTTRPRYDAHGDVEETDVWASDSDYDVIEGRES